MRSQANLLVRVLSAADVVLLSLILASVWTPAPQSTWVSVLPILLVVPCWASLLAFFGLYESQRLEGTVGLTRKVLSAQVAGAVIMAALLVACGQRVHLPQLGRFVLVGGFALALERVALNLLLRALRSRGFDRRNVCVIGSWESATGIDARFNRNPEWGLRVTCVGVGAPEERSYLQYPDGAPTSTSLEDVLRTHVIDEILVVLPPEELPRERATLVLCAAWGVHGRVMLTSESPGNVQPQLQMFTGETTITVGMVPGDSPHAVWKRAIDIVLGCALLLLVSPLLLVSALLVKLSSPGPVIFKQDRAGWHGRPFVLYKFRTMVDGAEGMLRALAHRSVTGGPMFKDRADVRVTPIGLILRRFSIDELPQLVCVIRGDMSLVGPRPLPLHEAALISGVHRRRFSMRPGITCLWQVNGRSNVEFAEWMKYDLEYVDRWSFWLDAKLLLQTIPAVMFGKGAY